MVIQNIIVPTFYHKTDDKLSVTNLKISGKEKCKNVWENIINKYPKCLNTFIFDSD